jgi:hypothetical protein
MADKTEEVSQLMAVKHVVSPHSAFAARTPICWATEENKLLWAHVEIDVAFSRLASIASTRDQSLSTTMILGDRQHISWATLFLSSHLFLFLVLLVPLNCVPLFLSGQLIYPNIASTLPIRSYI